MFKDFKTRDELTLVELFICIENLVIMCSVTNFYLEHVNMVLFGFVFFVFVFSIKNKQTNKALGMVRLP